MLTDRRVADKWLGVGNAIKEVRVASGDRSHSGGRGWSQMEDIEEGKPSRVLLVVIHMSI